MTDPTPPAFLEAVQSYLAGREAQFNYDALVHTFTDIERFHRWARYMDRLHPLAGARVLSSGCGAGGSLLAYADAGAELVEGVEVDAQFAHMARSRVADVDGVEVHELAPEARLPIPDGSVDVIESMDVIEHVPDDERYLRELRRVLAPGGIILVVTPNRIWPVEQHLGIAGPPWLPIGMADTIFGVLALLPWLSSERRQKYRELRGMRTQNMSMWRLRRLAKRLDLHMTVLHRTDEPGDPLPVDDPRAERLLRSWWGKYLSPVKSLAVTYQRRR